MTAFVGCGGKTSLIEGIITEAENFNLPVIHTTTTKIYPPKERKFILGSDIQELIEGIKSVGDSLVTAAYAIDSGESKLLGFPVKWFNTLLQEFPGYCMLIEADGCRGQSIKIYRENEPCLPPETDRVVILTGMDAFTCCRIEEKMHRYDLFQRFFPNKKFYTLQDRIDILFHSKGLITKIPKEIKKVLFLNKVTEATLEQARMIADLLLEKAAEQLDGVLIGNTFEKPMIYEYRK
ncbi:selenium cofactor biosynthesis protein YqeC [Geosporobacter ferrireducens]|nr:selenium cofactor biosynthesis protein YqeC [Geosporobacter ferrireducens]